MGPEIFTLAEVCIFTVHCFLLTGCFMEVNKDAKPKYGIMTLTIWEKTNGKFAGIELAQNYPCRVQGCSSNTL